MTEAKDRTQNGGLGLVITAVTGAVAAVALFLANVSSIKEGAADLVGEKSKETELKVVSARLSGSGLTQGSRPYPQGVALLETVIQQDTSRAYNSCAGEIMISPDPSNISQVETSAAKESISKGSGQSEIKFYYEFKYHEPGMLIFRLTCGDKKTEWTDVVGKLDYRP